MTISNLLKVLPSKQKEPEPNTFLGKAWLVDVPHVFHKYPHLPPIIGTTQWECREQIQRQTWNEVEYSRIIVLQKGCDTKEPWSTPNRSWSLSRHQDPESSSSGPKPGKGVWLQNLTYEALLGVGSYNKALEATPEFPLLVDLVAVEGELQPPESPHK